MSNVIANFIKNRQSAEPVARPDELFSPAVRLGQLIAKKMSEDPHFYLFSPDETTSNKLDAVFDVEKRAWSLPIAKWDLPEASDGRIVEMLSENVLFSVMTGHIMNGEPAMMTSYESFFSIITSQILQQMKFFKQCNSIAWRKKYPAINLLSTSTCWRQDHNGFTHQSPALISTLLAVPSNLANCLFPVDDLSAEEVFYFMLNTRNVVNLTTFNKIDEPRFTDKESNRPNFHTGGAQIFESVSDENPDFVFAAAGDLVTKEAIEAIKILRRDLPELKLRFVSVNALSYRAIGTTKAKLTKERFNELFTENKPIIAAFHGYPETFETILENYTYRGRLRVHGFVEEGSTTTPFEMLRRNAASRYDMAIDVAKVLKRTDLVEKYQATLLQNQRHAVQFGEDLIK